MKTRKLFLILSLFAGLISVAGCSNGDRDERRAKRIYEMTNLSKRERIDRLYALYVGSYKGYGSYNKAAADRAWKAILDGNYQKAANITDTYKSDSYNPYAKIYAQKLQEGYPQPASADLIISSGGGMKLQFVYNSYDTNCPYPEYDRPWYKATINMYDSSGKRFYVNICDEDKKPFSTMTTASAMKGNKYVRMEIQESAYSGWSFSYFNDSSNYVYSFETSDITKLSGTFSLNLESSNAPSIF